MWYDTERPAEPGGKQPLQSKHTVINLSRAASETHTFNCGKRISPAVEHMVFKLQRSITFDTHVIYCMVPASRPFLLLSRIRKLLVASVSLKNRCCAVSLPL